MKHSALLLAGLACASQAYSQALITGIIDGPRTGGLPKGIEIYITQDIADLSVLSVESGTNGAAPIAPEFTLIGSAAAGTFITIASESTGWTAYFGTAPTFVNGAMNINGDDPIYLWLNDAVIDAFGTNIDPDPDTSYNYLDTWWYRNDLTEANPTWSAADWVSAPGQSDALDALGTSGVNPVNTDPLHMPLGSFVYSAVPEPSACAAIFGGLALAGAAATRRRRTE